MLEMKSISRKTEKVGAKQRRRLVLSMPAMRVTSQRALILEIFREGEGHLDADEIYRRARIRQPRISLSTVYRTLKALKEPGLIKELHFDDTHRHYEAKSSAGHHHLVCLGCGKVTEFEYPFAQHVTSNVPEARDFEVVDIEVRMTGYCSRCRRKKE